MKAKNVILKDGSKIGNIAFIEFDRKYAFLYRKTFCAFCPFDLIMKVKKAEIVKAY